MERPEDMIPEHQGIAVVLVRFHRHRGVVPAVHFICTENVIQPPTPQIEVGVLQHQHRLAQGQVTQHDLRWDAQQQQRERAQEEIVEVVQRMEAEVVERVKTLTAVVKRMQLPQQ